MSNDTQHVRREERESSLMQLRPSDGIFSVVPRDYDEESELFGLILLTGNRDMCSIVVITLLKASA